MLLIGCSSTIVKQKLVKDEIVSVHKLNTGSCEYAVEPKHNYRILVIEKCGKYDVGDSLYRVVEYRVKK